MERERTPRIVIVGGGFSGLGVAIELMRGGIDDFVILEKSSQLGGTWRDNTYPGCACDVPSQLYSFSYAPNPDWSRVFASSGEIQQYLLSVAERFGVMPHVRLNAEVTEARWCEDDQRWAVESSVGRFTPQFVVSAAGPLHAPRIPELPGLDRFAGKMFHSARWDHQHDLTGRKVAVVGSGSSAIQLIPEIQPKVGALTFFQRTPAWVLPKPDHAIPAIERAAFRWMPGFQKSYRNTIYGVLELLQLAQRKPKVMQRLQRVSQRHLHKAVADPELRKTLTPDWIIGCKRLLLSNNYYPSLVQPNVEVVPHAVQSLTETGVVGAAGREREVDTVVFATGFSVAEPPIAEVVHGKSGTLASAWKRSPRAYLGTTVPEFPNMFVMLGPNMGNGHTSAFIIIEAQAKYIRDAIAKMDSADVASLEVKPKVEAEFNDRVEEALAGTVWNSGGCASWYIDSTGRNSSIYPWTTIDLRRRLAKADLSKFILQPRRRDLDGKVVAITGGARGIGLATARRFAARGARVCLGDLDLEEAQRAAAPLRGHAFHLDVTDRASFVRFVDDVERAVGPIDVLVNNAGIMPTGRFLDEPDEVHTATMNVNVWGPSLGMRIVLPRMIQRGRGHVVNVASMAGKIHVPGLSTYVASKHAVVGLTAAVRDEIAGTGVHVGAVLPGAVRTRLSAGIPLEGLFALEPNDVAKGVERCVARGAAEVVVPGWLAGYPLLDAALGERLMQVGRSLLGDDRVLTREDDGSRDAYEAAIVAQGERRDEARSDGHHRTPANV